MTTYSINEDERYPVFSLNSIKGRITIDLTDEEFADYNNACEKWEAWQDRLGEMVDAWYDNHEPRTTHEALLPPGVSVSHMSPPENRRQ